MMQNSLRRPLTFIILAAALIYASHSFSGDTDGGALIHIDSRTHIFPPVFEGEELSHDFIVCNKGTAELHIHKVTHA